jgi:uncharacterized protein (DUF1501 family)
VLVVVQLSGGNDGLNSVVPYADDEYAKHRTTLRLTGRDVLKIDDHLGFHPALAEYKRLFDQGLASVVQGVGYPKSNRNHPEAARDWQTARPGDHNWPTGWVGQIADQFPAPTIPAAFVGPIAPPVALTAERAIIPAFRTNDGTSLLRGSGIPAATGTEPDRDKNVAPTAVENLLDYVRTTASVAGEHSRTLQSVTSHTGKYPNTQLAHDLRIIANLIRAEIGYRILYTELGGGEIGGFDNHAGQKDNHAALLRQFGDAVAAFMDDLHRDGLADRVLLMTISEFGRSLAENGRRGTDHGAAAPIFLAGGKLKPGLIGAHPDLRNLDNGAPRHHTDFRSVYATAFASWLGLDAATIIGKKFEPVELFRS